MLFEIHPSHHLDLPTLYNAPATACGAPRAHGGLAGALHLLLDVLRRDLDLLLLRRDQALVPPATRVSALVGRVVLLQVEIDIPCVLQESGSPALALGMQFLSLLFLSS